MLGERLVDGLVVYPAPEEVVEIVVSTGLASFPGLGLERLNEERVQAYAPLRGLLAQRTVDPGRNIPDGVLMCLRYHACMLSAIAGIVKSARSGLALPGGGGAPAWVGEGRGL